MQIKDEKSLNEAMERFSDGHLKLADIKSIVDKTQSPSEAFLAIQKEIAVRKTFSNQKGKKLTLKEQAHRQMIDDVFTIALEALKKVDKMPDRFEKFKEEVTSHNKIPTSELVGMTIGYFSKTIETLENDEKLDITLGHFKAYLRGYTDFASMVVGKTVEHESVVRAVQVLKKSVDEAIKNTKQTK